MRTLLVILCVILVTRAAQTAENTVIVDTQTAAVLKGALKWLASQQNANGSWSIPQGARQLHPVAMTGYTLMAFLANGILPEEGEYSKNVSLGMQFLLESIQPDGTFRGVDGSKYMYSHGIATIALSEIYGQTKSTAVRPSVERLIKVIVSAQSEEGGWRYQPRPKDADVSATVLQVVALRAAKNAGLDVPQATIDNAVTYVRHCFEAGSGGFNYQISKHEPGFARTAAAIYSLQVCGYYDDPLVKAGSDYLFKKADEKRWWTYGNYYAAPAQYMIGGDTWGKWYEQIKNVLLKNVQRQGELAHWEPNADNGKDDVGAVYCTAVYTNILAMPYHYIPLYQR
jgi:squalene cyclase